MPSRSGAGCEDAAPRVARRFAEDDCEGASDMEALIPDVDELVLRCLREAKTLHVSFRLTQEIRVSTEVDLLGEELRERTDVSPGYAGQAAAAPATVAVNSAAAAPDLTSPPGDDAAVRREWGRLNSELANGRLALLASTGSQLGGGVGAPASGSAPLRAGVAMRAGKKDEQVDEVLDIEVDDDDWEEDTIFDPREQVGAMPPLGYFDPLGFCKFGDEATFRKYRSAELKHGRVAMMATVGSIVQHYVKLPGFEGVRNNSLGETFNECFRAPGVVWFSAFTAVILLFEINFWIDLPYKEPGNFGDPLGVGMYDRETREKELNNGRFAMFAAAGILAAQVVTGKDGVEQLGLG